MARSAVNEVSEDLCLLKHAEWEALSALEGLNGMGVVRWLIFELIVDHNIQMAR